MVPLGIDAGIVAGHRVTLLSLERWEGWADLRFARVDVRGDLRLTRRVPPPEAWNLTCDGEPLEVFDAVGRGDRWFSNGEVRLTPPPPTGSEVRVVVTIAPGHEPLDVTFTVDDA